MLKRSKLARATVATSADYIPFAGGLDLVTPPIQSVAGTLIDARNWEIDINSGYQTILGYERFDGRPSPSNASYSYLGVTFTGVVAAGNTVVGSTSGATGVVTITGADFISITKVSGVFVSGEVLTVSAVPVATTTSIAIPDGGTSSQLRAYYRSLAANNYRADIGVVPGAGRILGVYVLGSTVYAFRNNAGNTAAVLYKSSSVGWTSVPLGMELSFNSGGTYVLAEGDTITGASSGATAVVTRISLQSGTFAAGTAAGRIIFASQTGTFTSENLNVGANLNIASISGDSAAITLLPDGNYEFVTYNFYGATSTARIYGCDGVNRGFEFDGTIFAPISTGMADDTPNHVIAHKNHLFFSFGASLQHSGIGAPFTWTVLSGAAELTPGDTIEAFGSSSGSESGGALGVFCRNSIHFLYGSSAADWQMVTTHGDVGAYANTVQEINSTIMLDDRGLISMQPTLNYGNFEQDTISQLVQPWIVEQRSNATSSCIVRDKNQYRLFFSNGYALFATFYNRKLLGCMTVLMDNPVLCCCSVENSDGVEVIYFGSSDGYIYQMERGTSFDGASIPTYIKTRNLFLNSPRINKKFVNLVVEVEGQTYAQFGFRYELGYNSPEIAQPIGITRDVDMSLAQWDDGVMTWDTFTWDGQVLAPSNLKIDGTAENISLIFSTNSDYFGQIKLSGAVIGYIPRRRLR